MFIRQSWGIPTTDAIHWASIQTRIHQSVTGRIALIHHLIHRTEGRRRVRLHRPRRVQAALATRQDMRSARGGRSRRLARLLSIGHAGVPETLVAILKGTGVWAKQTVSQ